MRYTESAVRIVDELQRYHRQILLPDIGESGQRRLLQSHALIVGGGALGTMIADALARAGVGTLSIVDRDTVELTNLQRQVLYDEDDVAQMIPKAEAAKNKLARINSQVVVHGHVDDFSARNAERYVEGVDVILDGLDNFETRYLLNDVAVKHGLPYVYGGAVGTTGMSFLVLPHPQCRAETGRSLVRWSAAQSTPCLRCVFPEAPPPGASPTCDTAGVLGAAVAIIAAHQCAQAIKLLTGNLDKVDRSLLSIDVWSNQRRTLDISGARDSDDCPCCVRGDWAYLQGRAGGAVTTLCGRDAVQITPGPDGSQPKRLDLAAMAAKLSPHGSFTQNAYLMHGRFSNERSANGEPVELTLFPDGRAIIKGTDDLGTARSIYAKYIGA